MTKAIKSSTFLKIKRRLTVLFWLIFKCNTYKSAIKQLLASVIDDLYKHKSKIEKKKLFSLIDTQLRVSLPTFETRDGNTTYYEQISLASLVKFYNPQSILEVGTFNGYTTLNFALNTPESTHITTVDLPYDLSDFSDVLEKDLPFIKDKKKHKKLYELSNMSHRVRQIYADSTKTDFCAFQSQSIPFNFIFIDAGHSYMCVKNDTEKALKVLSEKGIIVWHDFTPNCPGVFKYLNELKKSLSLCHIENTTLVFYRKI